MNGDLYLWTWVTMGKFYFYKDGTDKTHLLYKSQRYLTGTNFVFPAELAKTELEPLATSTINSAPTPRQASPAGTWT